MGRWLEGLGVGAKVALAIGAVFLLAALGNVIWLSHQQSEAAVKKAESYASGIAETVLSSLNTMMESGFISERHVFIELMEKTAPGLHDMRVFRSPSVTEQYGPGDPGEQPVDAEDRAVLESGKPLFKVVQLNGQRQLRAVIPFILSTDRGGIDCTNCHEGKSGTVNGAISMLISLDEADREAAANRRNLILLYLAELAAMIAVLVLVIRLLVSRVLFHISDGLSQNSAEVGGASGKVAHASKELAEAASQQAAAVEEATGTLTEIAESARRGANEAQKSRQKMLEARQEVRAGLSAAGEMVEAIQAVARSSAETSKIIKSIDEIAFQTNLLALNASVEAARAGEHGKGFAVVAEEVRNLAQRSAQSAKDTEKLITESVQNSERGKALVETVASALKQIAESSGVIANEIELMAAASGEMASGVEGVKEAIENISRISQNLAATSDETASASNLLSEQVDQLHELIAEMNGLVNGRQTEEHPPSLPPNN